MLMYSPLSAFFDNVILQQPALINDGKQRQPALGDFISPILVHYDFMNFCLGATVGRRKIYPCMRASSGNKINKSTVYESSSL
jgi:hypothetical protein